MNFCSSASKNRIFIVLMVLMLNISAGKIMGKSNLFANYVKCVENVHFLTRKRSHHMQLYMVMFLFLIWRVHGCVCVYTAVLCWCAVWVRLFCCIS